MSRELNVGTVSSPRSFSVAEAHRPDRSPGRKALSGVGRSKWPKIRLGEVVNPVQRAEIPLTGKTYRQIGVRLWGKGAYERESIDGSQTKYAQFFRAEAGDLIVNKIWARNGSIAVIPESLAGCFASGEFPMFEPKRSRINPLLMHWLTKTHEFWDQCDDKSRGTSGKNRIRPERFLEIEIPLPPLPEQQRIVACIEALAAKITEARTLRNQAAGETEVLIDSALNHLRLSTTSKSATIAMCSRMSTGTTPPTDRTDYYDGPIQWFTPGDLGHQKELGRSIRTLSDVAVAEGKARIFKPGTVLLVAIGGSLGKVGLVCQACSANQQITGMRFNDEVLPDYGYWWLRKLKRDFTLAAPQATLPIINQRRIGAFEIIIPPLSEQRRIVDELDALQAEADMLKRLQVETAAELAALLPSILDKAFRGSL